MSVYTSRFDTIATILVRKWLSAHFMERTLGNSWTYALAAGFLFLTWARAFETSSCCCNLQHANHSNLFCFVLRNMEPADSCPLNKRYNFNVPINFINRSPLSEILRFLLAWDRYPVQVFYFVIFITPFSRGSVSRVSNFYSLLPLPNIISS